MKKTIRLMPQHIETAIDALAELLVTKTERGDYEDALDMFQAGAAITEQFLRVQPAGEWVLERVTEEAA